MMRRVFLLILAAGLILFACKNEKDKQGNESTVETADSDSLALQVKNAPQWALSVPQKEGYLYAVGKGSSLRPELARKKAMLEARVKLAEKLSGRGDSLNVFLRRSRVKEETQIKDGGRWRSFVLLEVPLADGEKVE
ncbi:LPP20 family lipoprotein [Caldithrix abyssi]|uniref:LPP20 lipoprotein n=2 Tax=Caldithrix abyssi DSM 13497 TaxID=880073 RepID=A0A1J1C740_CALAY|nr:LPP20 family lipoprotein [Caldithrix abyssi]APF18517.1 LPP20 lipoprotein [Caldithrix abyssi DSM 13497]